jgi:hypothetical protein
MDDNVMAYPNNKNDRFKVLFEEKLRLCVKDGKSGEFSLISSFYREKYMMESELIVQLRK